LLKLAPVKLGSKNPVYEWPKKMKINLFKKTFTIILTTIFLFGLNVIPANASTTVACSGGGEFHIDISGTTVVEKPGPGGTICAGEAIIPDTILTIGEYAFYDTQITSVIIPNSVTTIVGDAFSSTPLLNSITIPNSVTTIENFAFYQSALTSVTIGNQVATIGSLAFFDNTGLTTVNFSGNAPASVADNAFENAAVGAKAYVFVGKTGFPPNGSIWKGLEIVYRSEGGGGGGGGEETSVSAPWVGAQSIACPSPNPWVREKLGFASNAKPVLVSAENTIGKTVTQSSYDALKSSGVVFDTVSTKVSTATETLPIYGCKDKLLSGKVNQPIQFIAGGYTLQSDAHGYINTSDLKWHDTNSVTLYTNTAAFMHTIKFTNPGRYVVVLTEQPDTSRGLIPTYGVRSVRFVINVN